MVKCAVPRLQDLVMADYPNYHVILYKFQGSGVSALRLMMFPAFFIQCNLSVPFPHFLMALLPQSNKDLKLFRYTVFWTIPDPSIPVGLAKITSIQHKCTCERFTLGI